MMVRLLTRLVDVAESILTNERFITLCSNVMIVSMSYVKVDSHICPRCKSLNNKRKCKCGLYVSYIGEDKTSRCIRLNGYHVSLNVHDDMTYVYPIYELDRLLAIKQLKYDITSEYIEKLLLLR